jgi:hypothetical protein
MVYQLSELDKPSRQSSQSRERDDCHPNLESYEEDH